MQIIWEPYTDDVISALPDYCTIASDLWLTISPLICFHIVEWHRPDRVLRQFGLVQHIPEQCDTELGLHRYDLRGRHDFDWMSIHHHYIQRWEARYDHLARAEAAYTSYGYNHPYMVWYRSITRLFLTPHGSSWEIVVITMSFYLLLYFLLITKTSNFLFLILTEPQFATNTFMDFSSYTEYRSS